MFILSRLKIESALIKQAQEGVDPVEKNAAENLKNLLLVHHIIISLYLICFKSRRLHYPPFKQLRLEEKVLFKLCYSLCYLYVYMCRCNISNGKDCVLPHFQTQKIVNMCSRVFLTNFEVFGNLVKYGENFMVHVSS